MPQPLRTEALSGFALLYRYPGREGLGRRKPLSYGGAIRPPLACLQHWQSWA
ncbi:MAG TPA: hypothetical protein VLS96_10765 [Nodosilinea sp.]|nr:hypothetical protein [Nodosilinea sp.]